MVKLLMDYKASEKAIDIIVKLYEGDKIMVKLYEEEIKIHCTSKQRQDELRSHMQPCINLCIIIIIA